MVLFAVQGLTCGLESATKLLFLTSCLQKHVTNQHIGKRREIFLTRVYSNNCNVRKFKNRLFTTGQSNSMLNETNDTMERFC